MSLLVGTTDGAFALGDTTEELIGGTRINHIARDGDGWWAADGLGRILYDGQRVATMPEDARPLCVQPTPDTVWIGADRARLFALDMGVLTEDEFFTEAPGRNSWYTPWGAPADVRSMTLDADRTLYVNVHVGGILRYDDTGLVPTLDISADVHQVAAHPSSKGAIFAATAQGLATSHNGHDFVFRTDGLHANYCRAVAVFEDGLLISASTGPRTSRARLYRGSLWEGDLVPVGEGLPEWFAANIDTYCLTASGAVAHLGHGGSVWRSENGGSSWALLTDGLPRITCLA